MKKISTLIAILALILVVFSINASGQSLKSKIWQSQDSTSTRTRPSTLVLNPDGTYYKLGYHFNSAMELFNFTGGFEEGTYTDSKNTLTLTRYIGAEDLAPITYKITWLNNSEFTFPVGINKYHFAELGSDVDIFTPKFLIPYIKRELRAKIKIDPCYKDLVDQINAAKDQRKEEAVSNSKLIRKTSLIGTIWQMQIGKDREARGRLNNISFDEDGMIREIAFTYANGYITGTDSERKQAYRENSNEIVTFNENATVSTPLQIKWESEDQLMIKGYYYARFNSDKDTFSKDYLKYYTQTLIENARPVYPAFLELFAGNQRTVTGKIYEYVGDNECEAPYRSFEFQKTNECCVTACSKILSGRVDKYYSEASDCLFLRKRTLLSVFKKPAPWEEKIELKWLNSQEFLLTKDEKSYRYVFKGITPEITYTN